MAPNSANNKTYWRKRFKKMFEAINGPGPFTLDDGYVCPFCDDEQKIPVVINNSLSTEIKKIPLRLLCDEAGLYGRQVDEILKANEHSDYVVDFYPDNYANKSQYPGQMAASSEINTALRNNMTLQAKRYHDSQIQAQVPRNYVPPPPGFQPLPQSSPPAPPQASRIGILPLMKVVDWIDEPEFKLWNRKPNDGELWPPINKSVYFSNEDNQDARDDENKNITPPDNKREVESLCRLKDPYLLAVNAAIFGNKEGNYPEEGTEDYYKAAQQCALYGVTFSDPDSTASTTTDPTAPTTPTKKQMKPSTESDVKQPCDTQTFYRTQQGGDRNTATKKQHQLQVVDPLATMTTLARTGFAPTMFYNAATAASVAAAAATAAATNTSTTINQYPQALIGLNIAQKPKTVPMPKYIPKGMTAPQQILLQKTRQGKLYPYTATPYQQTLTQPQPLIYTNPLLATPYFNTCFKETHVNTAIIQQQQYNFFTSGSYEMLIYAQMLQQTQMFISKNRAAALRTPLISNPGPNANNLMQNTYRSNATLSAPLPTAPLPTPIPPAVPLRNPIPTEAISGNDKNEEDSFPQNPEETNEQN